MRASTVADLNALKLKVAAIEGMRADFQGPRVLPLGIAAIDAALQGGLMCGAVHEIEAAGAMHRGAAFGFALALAGLASRDTPSARRASDVLWIETGVATAETGKPYAPGFAAFGLSPARLIVVRVTRPVDLLWVLEEALRCRGLAAVIAELTSASAPHLTATRRLSLAVRDSGGLGLLVHHRTAPHASAAMTRWQVAAARSRPDALGGLGLPAFDLQLTKNRHGPGGRWAILWDQHDRAFRDPALSFGVAPAAVDRPDRALRLVG
jgi:protein ImuA